MVQLTPGFVSVPYGDVEALKKAITPNTAAFMVEPIQGEGGVDVPPEGYLKACYDVCKAKNVLFVADEIQSGLGRTGKMLACEHESVRPDVVIIGKALSAGTVPVSAVLSDKEVLGLFKPGDHGSTYGGAPLGCRAAREALKVLVEEKMVENSAKLGKYLMEKLQKIKSPHVDFFRGKGLWIGVVLKKSARGTSSILRSVDERRIAVQGNPCSHYPTCTAVVYYQGRIGLGARAHREGFNHVII